jgi:hypothetical protein
MAQWPAPRSLSLLFIARPMSHAGPKMNVDSFPIPMAGWLITFFVLFIFQH